MKEMNEQGEGDKLLREKNDSFMCGVPAKGAQQGSSRTSNIISFQETAGVSCQVIPISGRCKLSIEHGSELCKDSYPLGLFVWGEGLYLPSNDICAEVVWTW